MSSLYIRALCFTTRNVDAGSKKPLNYMRLRWQISSQRDAAAKWHKSNVIIARSRVSAAARESCRSDTPCFPSARVGFFFFFYSFLYLFSILPPRVATNAWSPLATIVRAAVHIRQKALPASRIIESAHMQWILWESRAPLLSRKKK